MTDECLELKNIKYQTMLLNNNSKVKETKPNNVDNIERYLEKEKELNKTKPWGKLGKASKLKRIYEYADDLVKKNKYSEAQQKQLKSYLLSCLDRKKLQRQKDVVYDMKTNKIKSIPGLLYNKPKNKFTLKRQDKKTSTLKCLAPKKNAKSKSEKRKKRKKEEKEKKNKEEKEKKKKKKKKKKTNKIDTDLKI